MSNLISKIIKPWYPATAIGLEKGQASVVHLERTRGNTCTIRHAATFSIADSLLRPSFEDRNIDDPAQLASVLAELATSAGLLRQKRWSVALPEATSRTLVLTLESQPQSKSELHDVLTWKMERGFGVPLDDVSVSSEKLQRDAHGRYRYLVIGIKKNVLAEYEGLFTALGWRAGLLLPRHFGEAQWLMRSGARGDSLLLSSSTGGFTAVVFRDDYPLIVRTVECAEHECEDEFFRMLLFYRDRRVDGHDREPQLSRLMVVGNGLSKQRVAEIVKETTGGDLRSLDAEDLGLQLPGRDLKFDAIAAPAGLASLSL